jgi:predicted glycoside hydrolase/deacetylase ChbG (UPF0249 family)
VCGVRVIFNADDLGMDAGVNEAVLDALASGTCTSASVLANGPATAALEGRLAAFPDVSFGVHLDLTEFAPLTPVASMQDLLVDGRFSPASLTVRREHADAVYEEWCAQVLRVRDLGVTIAHLDSHQHVHYHPVLFRVLKRVQARFSIDRVRGMAAWRTQGGVRALRQLWRAAWFVRQLRRDTPETVTTDGFGSVSLFRQLARDGLLHGDTFEVMCHPGNRHDPAYAEEMVWLAGDWRAEVPGVTPISWWGVA